MTFFKALAVLSRWNGNCQEPETSSKAPTSLHCCSLVRGEPCRPFLGAHTPFCCQDFDQPFSNLNANIQRGRHYTRWDNVVQQLMSYHVVQCRSRWEYWRHLFPETQYSWQFGHRQLLSGHQMSFPLSARSSCTAWAVRGAQDELCGSPWISHLLFPTGFWGCCCVLSDSQCWPTNFWHIGSSRTIPVGWLLMLADGADAERSVF